MQFKITIRNTCLVVYPGGEALDRLGKVIDMLTYEDEFSEQTVTLGIIYDEDSNRVFLHKGLDPRFIKKLLGDDVVFKYDTDYEGEDMNYQFEELIAPRNVDQTDVINFIAGQKEFADNLDDPRLFVVKKPGFGKSLIDSTIIPTPRGDVELSTIKPGDFVFNIDGKPVEVLGVFPQRQLLQSYVLTFSDGRKAFCSKDHLWNFINIETNKMETLSVNDLLSKGYINTNHPGQSNKHFKYILPNNGVVEYDGSMSYTTSPWTFGVCLMLADFMEEDLSIKFNKGYFDRYKTIIKTLAYHNGWLYKINEYKRDNFVCVFEKPKTGTIKTKDILGIDKDWDLIDTSFINPYKYGNILTRSLFVAGIVESYCYIYHTATIKHQIYTILNQIVTIIRSLGFLAFFNKKKEVSFTIGLSPSKIVSYIMTECVRTEITKGLLYSKLRNSYRSNKLRLIDIKLWKPDQRMTCLLVNDDRHLFLANDYIVTHNTYCTGYGIGLYGKKALIIMHRDQLRTQWHNSLFAMNGFDHKYVHEISDTRELYDIAKGKFNGDYDVYLITHATFRAGLKRLGKLKFAEKIVKNLGIGIKVIDEAHLEFKDLLLMDSVLNVKRNIYLTATPGRSQRDEHTIYKSVFSTAKFYAPSVGADPNLITKWMNYITVRVNSQCPTNIYRYKVNRGKGMTPATYGKFVIERDTKHTHFKCCKELIMECYTRDSNAKVLILVPLISICDSLADFLVYELGKENKFEYALSVRTINSTNSKADNEYNKKADVIISTIGSMGVGTDVKGLTDIICMTPYASKFTAEQTHGRVRYAGKEGYYYDIIDDSVPMDGFWWKGRSKTLAKLSIKHEIWTWSE